MKFVLVLYPKPFNCYSKFERKLVKLLKNLDNVVLVFDDDHNGLISRFALAHNYESERVETSVLLDFDKLTHAVVFSDGEEFCYQVKTLRNSKIKTNVQKIKITRVVNIKSDPVFHGTKNSEDYEYIGRGSPWGNPYPIGVDGDDRDEVLRKYKYDFDHDKFLNVSKNSMLKLAGKRLGCFCKPYDCHGDFIADYLNSYDDGE
ncbi:MULTISPECIES: DUF4326 domain-containing protein [Vibrionaceae]|uniref:DUF4326 domain-containing protein n=1 Tax=Photobacterium damselae TaxID=38293 RepID=A0ABD6WZ93_PHODM|nr:hypothetical protein AYY27_11595 [Photobacterium damselae]POB85422.1 DUF4326 domain-containing protein [Vibrio vulnificus]PSU15066.1 DUF4326 domain-containing protein [Photobacterium damselae]